MTIVKSYDVFCDARDAATGAPCPFWTPGTTAHAGHSSGAANEARKVARSRGWRRRRNPDTGKMQDLCPDHAKETP